MDINKNPEKYVESEKPLEEHKHKGWFYHYPTKKFYRWDDIPYDKDEDK
tara:strand:- start:1197 stop:1343 length:147 start_codon:yes stop_codon:yes gene_type:complete